MRQNKHLEKIGNLLSDDHLEAIATGLDDWPKDKSVYWQVRYKVEPGGDTSRVCITIDSEELEACALEPE